MADLTLLQRRSAAARKGARTKAMMKAVRGEEPKCAKCDRKRDREDLAYCRECRASYMRDYRAARKTALRKIPHETEDTVTEIAQRLAANGSAPPPPAQSDELGFALPDAALPPAVREPVALNFGQHFIWRLQRLRERSEQLSRMSTAAGTISNEPEPRQLPLAAEIPPEIAAWIDSINRLVDSVEANLDRIVANKGALSRTFGGES